MNPFTAATSARAGTATSSRAWPIARVRHPDHGDAMSVRMGPLLARGLRTWTSAAGRTVVLVATASLLVACSKNAPPETPAALTTPVQDGKAPTTSGAPDPSVPPAGSVLTSTAASEPDGSAGRSNNAMSNAQESRAMPMPGQNNDHSAPQAPAKRASE